jgi:hypothetical protein
MKKNNRTIRLINKNSKYTIGSSFLGFILGCSYAHVCVFAGFYKVIIIFGNLKISEIEKNTIIILFRIENKKIYHIREQIKKNREIYQNFHRGFFSLIKFGKVYRLNRGTVSNLNKNHLIIKKLKIIGKKCEFDFILSINGYIWINQKLQSNTQIIKYCILYD